MTPFLDDGRLELDTNPVENAIRPICLTRKNALFAGHEVGAENWALLASIVATCQRRQPGRLHRQNAHGNHCRPSPKRNRRPHAMAVPQNVKPASIGLRLSAYGLNRKRCRR
ncbi:transposase [Bradyrhizobium pachyrhizi]|nr:transposase [Bradyrhizobium pachyrhizi]WFU54727.1 transposase [Bradyrhizobium pachyrhizi]